MFPIVPFAFDSSFKQWSHKTPNDSKSVNTAPSKIRIATFNILQSEYTFVRNFILRPKTRFEFTISLLTDPNDPEYIDADIIGLNEVDSLFLSMLVSHPIIQQQFYLSEIVTAPKIFPNGSITNMGNMILSRIPFDACYSFALPTVCDRNVTVGVFCNSSLVIASIHPTAHQDNDNVRKEQLSFIFDTMFSDKFSNSSVFVIGDTNLHQGRENELLNERKIMDLYHETVIVPFMKQNSSSVDYPPINDSIPNYPYGFTWSMYPLDGRKMRLDRILQKSSNNQIEWIAKGPVQIFAKEKITNSWYLRRSDHFGLLVDVERKQLNESLEPNKEFPLSCITMPCEKMAKFFFF